uniref:Calponin-homology (CH) domain-containing protein n=1 Tax=Panagrellus redivivus TaxID=6233 RepID=A0A7E4VAP2_PANRE
MSAEATATVAAPVVEETVEKKEVTAPDATATAIVEEVKKDGEAAPAAAAEEAAAAPEAPVEEPPKPIDPREDPIGWVGSLFPVGVHKANHLLLQWLQAGAIEKEEDRAPLPGREELVTKNQFLNYLRDGTLLAKFANAVAPGSIEKVHEGEDAKVKDNQKANIEGFITFVKEKAGLTEEQVFTTEDLQDKGKAGYNAVFNTIFNLGLKAQEKLNANGINVDQIVEAAQTAVKSSIIQQILAFFARTLKKKDSKKAVEDAPAAEEQKPEGEATEEVPKVEEPTVPAPAAVAAN